MPDNRTSELVVAAEPSLSSLRINERTARDRSITTRHSKQSRQESVHDVERGRLNNEPNDQTLRKRTDIDENERGNGKATNNTYSSVLKTDPDINGDSWRKRTDSEDNKRGKANYTNGKTRPSHFARYNDHPNTDIDGETWRKQSDDSDKIETNEDITQIFIKNIDKSSNEMDIRKLFEKFGYITNVKIFNDPNGRPNGCCRVEYNNSKSASEAIHKMNGYKFDECRFPLLVEHYKEKNEKSGKSTMASSNLSLAPNSETRLFVGNVTKDLPNNDLYDLFEKYGNLVEAQIKITNDKNRNYGIVRFRDRDSAQLAINELNGREIPSISALKMTLSVSYFTPK